MKAWPELLARIGQKIKGERTTAVYRVPWRPTHTHLCFCEAPACNESWRFGQSKPLEHVRPPMNLCPDAILNRSFDWDLSYAGLVAIGELIVAPPDRTSGILLLNTTSGNAVQEELNTSLLHAREAEQTSSWGTTTPNPSGLVDNDALWSGVATDGTHVYAAPWNVMNILVFNMATRSSYGISLHGHISARDRFVDVAVGEGNLYLLPGTGQVRVAIVNLATEDIRFKDLSKYSGGQSEADNPWLGAVVVGRKLFLTPHSSPYLVVINTSTEEIVEVEATKLANERTGEMGRYLWAGCVHWEGHVYAAPHDAERHGR